MTHNMAVVYTVKMESLSKITIFGPKIVVKSSLHFYFEISYTRINYKMHLKYQPSLYNIGKIIQAHIYQHHNPYECKECTKTFVNQGSYARHRRTIHANKSLKKFQCEHCHYSTHARQYLHEHKQR
jgi:hypothetical protein